MINTKFTALKTNKPRQVGNAAYYTTYMFVNVEPEAYTVGSERS